MDVTTAGETLAEARKMARDAVEGYLEAAKSLGQENPEDVRVERVVVPA